MDLAQQEFILRLLNTGVGQAASVLSVIADTNVNMVVPELNICSPQDIDAQLEIFRHDDAVSVAQSFSGILSGNAVFILSERSGLLITRHLKEYIGDVTTIKPAKEGVLSEVGNIVINNLIGSWSELFGNHFTFGLPDYLEGSLPDILETRKIKSGIREGKNIAMLANIHFDIKEIFAPGSLLILFESNSLEKLMDAVTSSAK